MTEIETLRIRARKFIKDEDTRNILDLRDDLFKIVVECDDALIQWADAKLKAHTSK